MHAALAHAYAIWMISFAELADVHVSSRCIANCINIVFMMTSTGSASAADLDAGGLWFQSGSKLTGILRNEVAYLRPAKWKICRTMLARVALTSERAVVVHHQGRILSCCCRAKLLEPYNRPSTAMQACQQCTELPYCTRHACNIAMTQSSAKWQFHH